MPTEKSAGKPTTRRYSDVLGAGRGRLEALYGAGALLQVNVCSLLGNHGLAVQETAIAIVRSGTARRRSPHAPLVDRGGP